MRITHTNSRDGIRFVIQKKDQDDTGYFLKKVERIKKADIPNTQKIESLIQLNEKEIDHGRQ